MSRSSRCAAANMLLLGIAGCVQVDDGPVGVADKFLAAVDRGDCATAWSHFSAGTQQNVREEVRRLQREAEVVTAPLTPETRYCQGSYGEYKRGSIRVTSQQADRATVAVVFSEGSRLAIIPFLSTPYKEWASELQLVLESGQWKIERPRVQVKRQGWEVVEVGAVDVSYSLRGDPTRRHVQATAVLHAPRDDLEGILRDAARWTRLLPGIEQVEVDAAPDGRQRLRMRLAGLARPVSVTAVPYGRLVDPQLPWTTLQWNADGPPPAPVLFTGSWKLQPRHAGGTRATFGLVIEPRQLPEELVSRLLDAKGLAAAIVGLESEALKAPAAGTARK